MLIEVASISMKKRIQGLTFIRLGPHHPIKPWNVKKLGFAFPICDVTRTFHTALNIPASGFQGLRAPQQPAAFPPRSTPLEMNVMPWW